MANEINIQAVLSVQRSTSAVQGAGTLPINQSGTKSFLSQQNVTTAANTTFTIDGTTAFAYVFMKNLDSNAWSTSNYVSIALDNAAPPVQVIARLRAGEFCLIPVNNLVNLYARASGAFSPDVFFVAVQG